ncbi:sporulation integral membrane protein YlbJ [Paenibacillus crassostreae]|uniref:Sporulation integral membrane protein YlbJ n=1 Tax=Paenibacillus crassostreae TaxID=1763538 RepID=A0A167CT42_9BACL|nr:sporulation integral membrane protein YlbJ [Paenibacillus crassostreae]AOZ93528.1 sporulation integral membrane protein YlbJ [Paenibacillus crassostreae]OAB73550.1 sporulation integral membrane protein YlbJ [Paenibacillus crassostreae]
MSIKSYFGAPLFIFGLLALSILMFIFPNAYLEAALRGMVIWWDVLFPSLFPFFIISEVLLGFGIVHLIGTLLDPLMRPIFRIPGSGGFVAAMGYVSGYPIGAKLTAQLWEQKMINRDEGERLVAFTTSSDPIFLIGAVSIGFFHNPLIVPILAIAHYGGGFLVGILMRFHGEPTVQESVLTSSVPSKLHRNRLIEAFRAMHAARINDGRNIGELFRQAILSSLQLMVVVGGLVVFFSVFLELLTQAGIMKWLYLVIEKSLSIVNMPPALSQSLVGGTFEVTLGARFAGQPITYIPLSFKVAAAAFILSWGGLSVHAQIASILHSTNIRYWPFLVARLAHGIIAACIVKLLWEPLAGGIEAHSTIFLTELSTRPQPFIYSPEGYINLIGINFIILLAMIIFAMICWNIKLLWSRCRRLFDK